MNSWTKILFYIFYLVTILGMLVPTVMTLLPGEASKQNHLGYVSRCSFAPWSTLSMVGITLFLIGIVYLVQILIGR
jgi:uncharacterized membrane protein YdjX (TVP38/TMEM64 family)